MDDPYTFGSDAIPSIEYPDIYNYFINTPSPCTKEDYKNSDGYKYLLACWVGNLAVRSVTGGDEKVVLTASVRH